MPPATNSIIQISGLRSTCDVRVACSYLMSDEWLKRSKWSGTVLRKRREASRLMQPFLFSLRHRNVECDDSTKEAF